MELIPATQDPHTPAAEPGKFHVRLTEGRFQDLRRLLSWPLITLFFTLAWVQRDGEPWLLFSFEQRRIILFGHGLLWHDLPLLAGLLITGACLLFFLAVGWGRVWCGFACPQSIWTWMFIRIEHILEGPAHRRARLENRPLRGSRLLRRAGKHFLWALLALVTAVTFTGYFIPIRDILSSAASFDLSATLTGWLVMMSALTYLNAGLIREKICLHACPYSRFQAVMFDTDTLTVSYDSKRGEPRASQRSANAESGDCIDCTLCIQVCPTGIDIRQGLQAACLDCGACIDACDRVMESLKRPKGLIRFASESELAQGTGKFLRPRLIGYGCIMAFGFTTIVYGFTNTRSLIAEVQRERGALFTRLNEETVCNNYRIKVEAATTENQAIGISLADSDGFTLLGPSTLTLPENGTSWQPYRICGADQAPTPSTVTFAFSARESVILKKTTFITALR